MMQDDCGADSNHCQLEQAKVTKQTLAWFKAPLSLGSASQGLGLPPAWAGGEAGQGLA